jgi:Spx/MgsR family transcriptional regulator
MLTLYGIRNCDKCRAALKWFKTQDIDIHMHDLRVDGIDAKIVRRWQQEIGSDALVNRRSQTWKLIPANDREGLDDNGLLQLVLGHPTLIKRPLLDDGKTVMVGYAEADWQDKYLKGNNNQ